jgi:RNA polymerase sigma-70 factor (ECF subfamily)
MKTNPDETENLIERTREGDTAAFEALFERHRGKLHKAIAMRMDRRVAARVDASDVLQETYLEAFKRLPKYLEQEGMPFYLWLHWIAREKVIGLHRRHLGAGKRSVQYEAPIMPTDSSVEFASGLIDRPPSPSEELARVELAELLRSALERLTSDERDLILWRHFEQISAHDMAMLLGITEAAANKRYIRAVERLRKILQDSGVSNPLR